MKIAFVLDDTLDKYDGVQQHVVTLGGWLTSKGHTVHYIVAATKRKDIDNIHSLSRFVSVKYNGNNVRTPLPASRGKIKELLNEEKFDLIHVQMPYSPVLAKRVIEAAGEDVALVGTFHILPAGRIYDYSNRLLRLTLRKSLSRFDKILAVSEPAVHFARKAYGIEAEYLPNPIDLGVFRLGKKLALYKDKKINIIFLGRLVKRKGVIELIDAFNGVDDSIASKCRLIVCGKGPLKKKASYFVRKDREVLFTGFIPEKDKPNYLASADIAVFPSTGGESFGIVLIEAMAAGSGVVIGGNNPGYSSVLGGQPYLLFNPKVRTSFIDILELFIEDKNLRTKMHEWQQNTVNQYDISVIGRKLINKYDDAIKQRRELNKKDS